MWLRESLLRATELAAAELDAGALENEALEITVDDAADTVDDAAGAGAALADVARTTAQNTILVRLSMS